MQFDFALVLVFAVAAVGFGVVSLLIGSLVRPTLPSPDKSLIYECGERPIGGAWFNFNPRFYIVALVFVVFEVEIALTLPVALALRKWVFKGDGALAFWELFAFVSILSVGLVWIWARRDLEWIRGAREDSNGVGGEQRLRA